MRNFAKSTSTCRGNAGIAGHSHMGTAHEGSWAAESQLEQPAAAPKEPGQRQVCERRGSPAARPPRAHSTRSRAAWRRYQPRASVHSANVRLWPFQGLWCQCDAIMASHFDPEENTGHFVGTKTSPAPAALRPAPAARAAPPRLRVWCATAHPARAARSVGSLPWSTAASRDSVACPDNQNRLDGAQPPDLLTDQPDPRHTRRPANIAAASYPAGRSHGPPGLTGGMPPAPQQMHETRIAPHLLMLQAAGKASASLQET